MTTDQKIAVSVGEAATLLGISKSKMYQYVHIRGFPAFKLGGRTLISIEGLREWVKVQANQEATA